MTNSVDIAFNSLNDDDFYDLLRPPNDLNESRNNPDNYDDFVAENVNSNSEELNNNLDSFDPVQNPSCKYLTTNQFKKQTYDSNNIFSLLHLNIRSINKHFEEFQLLLDNPSKQFSIIGLTETWLSQVTNQPYALPGYETIDKIELVVHAWCCFLCFAQIWI